MVKLKLLSSVMLVGLLVLSVSCEKGEPGQGNGNAKVTFSPEQSTIDSVMCSDAFVMKGSLVSQSGAITDVQFLTVKKEGDAYKAVGEPQSFNVKSPATSLSYQMDVVIDAKLFDHIAIKAVVGSDFATQYIPVTKVYGDIKAGLYMGDVVLKADTPVWTGDNHPLVLSAGQGNGSSTPSFFSAHGTMINGAKKHVLSLSELRGVEGQNASFCFLNVTYNTKNAVNSAGKLTAIGGQRGYMFSNMKASQLGGGTTCRQCDLYAVDGKGILDTKVDLDFTMKIVAGSWYWQKSSNPAEAEGRFKFIDSLYVVLGDEANSTAAKVRANYLLGLIQKRYDSSTLGVTGEEATSLGTMAFARRYTNSGSSATAAMDENFRGGDYLVLRSKRGDKYYYGILQITLLADDKFTFVPINGVDRMDLALSEQLFLKTNAFAIRMQTEE